MTSLAVIVICVFEYLGHIQNDLTRSDAVERVTRIELAWPAWKESARLLEPTRMHLLV
jgi:hypothetical protein